MDKLRTMNFADIQEQGFIPLYTRDKLTNILLNKEYKKDANSNTESVNSNSHHLLELSFKKHRSLSSLNSNITTQKSLLSVIDNRLISHILYGISIKIFNVNFPFSHLVIN